MKLKELQTWLTPTDAGRVLGISRQAVHKRLEEGKMGRAIKTRAGWLIDPEAVEDLQATRAHDVDTARMEAGEAEFVRRR